MSKYVPVSSLSLEQKVMLGTYIAGVYGIIEYGLTVVGVYDHPKEERLAVGERLRYPEPVDYWKRQVMKALAT
jgi:hypothetical protein